MELSKIYSLVNAKLAGELLTAKEMTPFLDNVVDDINAKLNACYPVFSDLTEGATEYSFFPDNYIRSVVVCGAAWYYFVVDEEGISTASQFQMDYIKGLFEMQRDMLYAVPEEYEASPLQGAIMNDPCAWNF